jgi:hypothetical protein
MMMMMMKNRDEVTLGVEKKTEREGVYHAIFNKLFGWSYQEQ